MKDRLLGLGSIVLAVANVVNWVCVAGFAVVIALSFPFAHPILAHLSVKYAGQPMLPVLNAMRVMFGLGILVGPVVHVVFTRLQAIVATAQAGDPFVAANARRLQSVGWALLAIQVLDLAFGVLTWRLAASHIQTTGWSPSVGGWLSVLMIFVLARVFTIGTRMRDELEMTV